MGGWIFRHFPDINFVRVIVPVPGTVPVLLRSTRQPSREKGPIAFCSALNRRCGSDVSIFYLGGSWPPFVNYYNFGNVVFVNS